MEDMDTSRASDAFVPGLSEDSVDIYEGLEMSVSSNTEKCSTDSLKLKESMDLYEEIVTEEQESRESSYAELKSRFAAAQNQIKELRRRLEQVELQNTALSTENFRLKKNISALLLTAKQEVKRKDAEIQRLNLISEKSFNHLHHHRHHHRQSHLNNLQEQKASSRISTESSRRKSPPPPPSCSNPLLPLPPPLPTCPPPPPACPPPPPPPPPPQPPSPLKENSPAPRRDPPHPSRKDGSSSQPSGSSIETRALKASSHSKTSSRGEGDAPDKPSTCPPSQHGASNKHKSKHREEKSDSTRRHRSGSDPSRSHKDTERRYDSRSGKGRSHLNAEGHHRSERTRSPAPETSHSEQSKNREQKQTKAKTSASDSEHSSKEGHSREHRKNKSSHRHEKSPDRKKSSSNRHSEHNRDTSKERTSKDHQRKEEKRHEEDVNRKHKKRTLLETSRKHEKTKEPEQRKADACSKEKMQEALKRPLEELNKNTKSSVDENSPNRKLCFMETLNLTLSPIKKPVLPIEDLTPVDRAFIHTLEEEDSQPNAEDMCVIDEVESSELEAEVPTDDPKTQPGLVKRHEDARDKQEGNKIRGGSNKQDTESPVQTTSTQIKPLKAAEKKTDERPKTNTQTSMTLKETEGASGGDKTRLASESVRDECRRLAAKDEARKEAVHDQKRDHPIEPILFDSNLEKTCRTLKTGAPVKETPAPSRDNSASAGVSDKDGPKGPTVPPSVKLQQEVSPPTSKAKNNVCNQKDAPKDADCVSSTITLECLPQEGLSLPEAIYMLTQTAEDHNNKDKTPAEASSSTGCIAVSKVSSTTEEVVQKEKPEKHRELNFTPKKCFSPGKSRENNTEPSSSMPFLHDEDSMMRTLSSLKRIPDAISPLRSPIHITKRSHLHMHGKPGHVKSLQKEFSSPPVDANSKKLDVNKENKYPGSPANRDTPVEKVSDPSSSLSDTDLEEGEILSETDETAADSPAPPTKRAKVTQPARTKLRTSEERRVSKEISETAGGGGSARSPRSRFKTVCPAATKAAFASVEDVMGTFRLVRSEIRKKYMKLHKTFPRKSFYGVMENFQVSFLEFVDGAYFGTVCSQEKELKSKLKKLITSVFSKVSNNGIVKRIFEQQAVDLKQKLWDFVDGQVDYMFKDIYETLKSFCKPTRVKSEDKKPSGQEKVSTQSEGKEAPSAPTSLNQSKPCTVVPYRTGLGSRGKDIRITLMENATNADSHPTQPAIQLPPPKIIFSTPEKDNHSSQNASVLDKTDFELLTEQQASSLTFNLVRDSQMGEIFKCLLQGSDLLETSGIPGDNNTAWSLSTPRKDGERLFSITTPTKFDSPSKLLSPLKFDSPSKLVAAWSSISPRKLASPRCKDQLNPALFDESCLLEVPNRATQHAGSSSQRSFSILAEDLAVSLTIPSPLKSDSHLSFLQPSNITSIMSTPDSVISAHISEDALMDGEDASEQDIHLALDTDISSCDSNSSTVSEPLAVPFVFKPNQPMQALVMERSNDHFILKIRQTASGADVTLTADDSLSRTLTEDDHTATLTEDVSTDKPQRDPLSAQPSETKPSNPPESSETKPSNQAATGVKILPGQEKSPLKTDSSSPQQNTSSVCFQEDPEPREVLPPPENSLNIVKESSDREIETKQTHIREEDKTTQQSPAKASSPKTSPHPLTESSETNQSSQSTASHVSDSDRDEVEMSGSERSLTILEDVSSSPEKQGETRKRKKHQEKQKAKRSRKQKTRKEEEEESDGKKDETEPKSSPASLSPSSLSAKNVVRKKGEVVMSWTRDEDRDILVGVKTKGASRETFSDLSEKLQKPSGQIAQRFNQLLKLFKKKEKMDT